MDWNLIGICGSIGLIIFLIGYFTGVNRAKTNFLKLMMKYNVTIIKKKDKPSDLEYGKK